MAGLTTIRFWLMNHLQRAMKGGMTIASRTFLMTSTVRGGLYQVRRWEAGSWMVLEEGVSTVVCLLDLHDHRRVFHDPSAWSELLDGTRRVEGAGAPAGINVTGCLVCFVNSGTFRRKIGIKRVVNL